MIRKALGLTLMAGVVSVFAFACGDDDDAGPKYPTVDSFCTAKSTLECSAGSVNQCAVPAETCKSTRKQACLTAASAATGRNYAPGNAEACLNLVTNTFADANNAAKLKTYQETCERVFSGTKTKGTPCTGAYDCTSDLICDLEKPTPLCATKSAPISEKSGCANSGDVCAEGLYCDARQPQLCEKKSDVNAACGAQIPCVATAYCDGSRCQSLKATGIDCTANAECASQFCNTSIGKCGGRIFPTETGTCKDVGGAG